MALRVLLTGVFHTGLFALTTFIAIQLKQSAGDVRAAFWLFLSAVPAAVWLALLAYKDERHLLRRFPTGKAVWIGFMTLAQTAAAAIGVFFATLSVGLAQS